MNRFVVSSGNLFDFVITRLRFNRKCRNAERELFYTLPKISKSGLTGGGGMEGEMGSD